MNQDSPKSRRFWRFQKAAIIDGVLRPAIWRRWWHPIFGGVLVLILAMTIALLINPAAMGPSLPVSEEAIGTTASADIRAPVNFPVKDIESTDRKRREAEDAVRSVYDFEQEQGTERIRRLKQAFGEMARVISAEQETEPPGEPGREPAEGARSNGGAGEDGAPKKKAGNKQRNNLPETAAAHPGGGPAGAKPDGGNETLRRSLDETLDARKDYFLKTLQVVVKEEDFIRLRQDRFSVTTLNAVTMLVDRITQEMIVSSRELLGAERGRGILVRYLRDGSQEREQVMMSFSRTMDQEEAWLRMEQAAALDLAQMPASMRTTVVRLAKSLVAPNLTYNWAETEKRKKDAGEAIQPLEIRIKKGELIIGKGDTIEKKHVLVFQEMKKLTQVRNATEMALGTVLLVSLLLLMATSFSTTNIRKFNADPKNLVLLTLVLFVFVISVKVWFWVFGVVEEQFRVFPLESYYYAIPFATGAMLIRFVLNSEMALVFTAVSSVLAGILMENSVSYACYCMLSSLAAAGAVGRASQRTSLLKAGVFTGLVNMAVAVSLSLFAGKFFSFEMLFNAIFAYAGGILVAIIVTGTAPVIEVLFGYTTDVKLMELANLNHPLLKDLIVQAPGSYHHSIIVGSMVEAAADSIHCKSLLAKVMAYYHDIGKVKNPAYFSENQRDGINRHDRLKPSLSAMVIKSHVKDGAELARASKLGQPIVDAILQHHGTSLIKFFYQKAKDQEDPENLVKEEDFRYPGPKPRNREVALVMLADAVEAAAKSIPDPSPARLQGMVQNIINRIFVDGQLDECDLTLKDLHEIARAFNRVLNGIYHHRPDYPEPVVKERDAIERKGKVEPEKEIQERREGEEKKQDELRRLGM